MYGFEIEYYIRATLIVDFILLLKNFAKVNLSFVYLFSYEDVYHYCVMYMIALPF